MSIIDQAYHREYYVKTIEKRRTLKRLSQKLRRDMLRDKLRGYKSKYGCKDCREKDPIVLTFDHINDDKKYNPSDMVRHGFSWENILIEIKKCEIVCANCHLRRSEKRRNR